ncbi:MAG: DUF4188 domain-containing protein [Pseudomonadota bacterium]
MNPLHTERLSAVVDHDFVVFLIGLRINKPWKVHRWLPVVLEMPRMLRELSAQPELGLLGHIPGLRVSVQYWRSFEHLEAYARSGEHQHLPAWKRFNQRLHRARGDVGIWHETYQVQANGHESVYSGMPAFGLGRVGRLMPATGGRERARQRLAGGADGTPAAPTP